MKGRLPDFVIIGALRAGTTSLFRYLGAHPDVYVSRPKEIRYFNKSIDKGPEWYASHFAGAHPSQICGEATPSYMSQADAMHRMRDLIPQALLVAILRDPVTRAWSHYWMRYERGLESRSFHEAIDEEMKIIAANGPDNPSLFYLGNGMYAYHLKRVLQLYPRDRVHICLFEHIRAEPRTHYQAVCRFLGIRDDVIPDIVGRPVNPYVTFRSLRLRRLTKSMPKQVGRLIGRLNTKIGASYPELDDATRGVLSDYFRQPSAELAELLDLTETSWTE